MEDLRNTIEEILNEEIIKIVISNRSNKEVKYNKINFILKENSKGEYYQIEQYTDKQVFHENIEKNMLKEKLLECMNSNYKQMSVWSKGSNFEVKISKKGKIFLGKKKSDNSKLINKSHNKEKITYLKRV